MNATAQGQGEKVKPAPGSQEKSEKKKTEACLFCKEDHCLDECKKFAEKPHKERKDFFYRKFLCLGCASSSQHQVASCKNRLKCRTCSGNHPTCLHSQKTPAESITTVSSIYDPSSFVAPVTLQGKQVLQQMCRDKLHWDSPVPESLRTQWEKWRRDVLTL